MYHAYPDTFILFFRLYLYGLWSQWLFFFSHFSHNFSLYLWKFNISTPVESQHFKIFINIQGVLERNVKNTIPDSGVLLGLQPLKHYCHDNDHLERIYGQNVVEFQVDSPIFRNHFFLWNPRKIWLENAKSTAFFAHMLCVIVSENQCFFTTFISSY